MNRSRYRSIPSVDALLLSLGATPLPRPVVVRLVRDELARLRRPKATIPESSAILDRIRKRIAQTLRARIQPVINATGILIHTNLGRSLLAPAAIERLTMVASRYSNLELDIESGARGIRSGYLEDQLSLLCQAEAATVVNNCAAALMLILRQFVGRRERSEVVISRGELVQIGGGFRVPEILEASGARLREVGTTNRTDLDDYRRALGPATALILKVHRSNFSMEGFVTSPTMADLATLARRARVPLVEDLGSGALVDTAEMPGIAHEPTPSESLREGADMVCFSGDKLMGGPQAGIIAGRKRFIAALKREPMFRALRCDKLVLAALEATAENYLEGQAYSAIPTLALARISLEDLRARASSLQKQLEQRLKDASHPGVSCQISPSRAQFGGGTLPRADLGSVTLDIRPRDQTPGVEELAARLRAGSPAVIGCLSGGSLKLCLTTVLPVQDDELLRAVTTALGIPC